ncbi:MAG: hypothetical protein J5817_01385 [Treponema sp.]|nr:hypothetical protein [Treponema sp.]
MNIDKKNVEVIEQNYSGGVPVNVSQLPVYYKIPLEDGEYAAYKKMIRNQYKGYWKIHKDELILMRLTKFDLGCRINKKEIIFGFSKMDMIHP